MQKPIRYYIQKSGERPTVRTVPVAAPRSSERSRTTNERLVVTPKSVERPARATAVGRIRLALKRGLP